MAKIILDAGHGGAEPGAIFEGRNEKDDNLRLALAVGDLLKKNGVDVAFTRTDDVYDTPFQKAQIANREGGDFLISFHRNSSPEPNQYSGVESLVYNMSGTKVDMAQNINSALEQAGFRNLGVKERPNLVILRRSRMPAVLVETGFLNTASDNALFDENFEEIAQAIADGILQTLRENGQLAQAVVSQNSPSAEALSNASQQSPAPVGIGEMRELELTQERRQPLGPSSTPETAPQKERFYRVQAGAFRNRPYAEDLLYQLQQQNFPAFILFEDNLFKVQVGAFRKLDNAVRMEDMLRRYGYSTFITT